MKYKVTFNMEAKGDKEMVKAIIIYGLRGLKLKRKDIEVEDLE